MELSQDKLLRAGMAFRRLKDSEEFDVAVDILKRDYVNRIVSSSYSDTAAREAAYKMIVALDDLVGVINTLVFSAEQQMLHPEEDDTE